MKKTLIYIVWAFILTLSQLSFATDDFTYSRYITESQHFKVIYWKSHSYLVPHIINAAETSLERLAPLFNYHPKEKIVISTADYHDFGSAGTTSVPHNFIHLDIAPLELDYESVPFNERIQWLLTHEMVHIIVGDGTSMAGYINRSLFSKVPPEREQPFFTIFYSLLTNSGRFSPEWHQESIAMFMETWLNGGFGRVLGNFDEMYFRSMVAENRVFPDNHELDTKVAPNSYLLQMLYYLYGARFSTYLAQRFGVATFIEWYKNYPNNDHEWYDEKFEQVFGINLDGAWQDFIATEIAFQETNLAILKTYPLTPVRYLSYEPLGWVTQPHFDGKSRKLIFGTHRSHELANFKVLDLKKFSLRTFATLPTPRMVQVAATAYDPQTRLLFYTTNNNYFQRDLWALDVRSNKKKLLFKDYRIGDLTICPKTRELWGIQHSQGKAVLVRSNFPYRSFDRIAEFELGIIIQHLSVSNSGQFLAATVHESSGKQSITIIDCNALKKTGKLFHREVFSLGSPEHPTWSSNDSTLFWNAYVNGVSNIYRYHLDSGKVEAISHTLRGLFRPIQISKNLIFAYEFTTEGFLPVIIPNKPAVQLPPIKYFGQYLVDYQPEVTKWAIDSHNSYNAKTISMPVDVYKGVSNIRPLSFVPIVTSFKDQPALGVYSHWADPHLVHDLKFEVALSPYLRNELMPRFHFDGKYEYKKRYLFRYQQNASNFYDLFNTLKRSTIQKKVTLGLTHYWIYDQPHKLKHINQIAAYLGAKAINDNMTAISRPDFFVYQSVLESTKLRRSIGSVDAEQGTRWQLTLMTFHVDPNNLRNVGGIHGEWEIYTTWGKPHNTFHFKIFSGVRHTDQDMPIGWFYFGGFGNRYLENEKEDQFRKAFRFPGEGIYSIPAKKRFFKTMLEQRLPPVRFGDARLGYHALSFIDLSCYTQALVVDNNASGIYMDLGAQLNLHFKHWFNLESTLSVGVAKSWHGRKSVVDWFISFKPLRT